MVVPNLEDEAGSFKKRKNTGLTGKKEMTPGGGLGLNSQDTTTSISPIRRKGTAAESNAS